MGYSGSSTPGGELRPRISKLYKLTLFVSRFLRGSILATALPPPDLPKNPISTQRVTRISVTGRTEIILTRTGEPGDSESQHYPGVCKSDESRTHHS